MFHHNYTASEQAEALNRENGGEGFLQGRNAFPQQKGKRKEDNGKVRPAFRTVEYKHPSGRPCAWKRVLIFANNNTWLWPCCYCPLTLRFGMQTTQAVGAPKKGRPAFGDITNAAAAARHTVHFEEEVRAYRQY